MRFFCHQSSWPVCPVCWNVSRRLNPSVCKTWPVGGWGWTARISDPGNGNLPPAPNSSDASRLSRRNSSDPSELPMPPIHRPPDQRCANADQINTQLPPHDPISLKEPKCFCYFVDTVNGRLEMTIISMTTMVDIWTVDNCDIKRWSGSQLGLIEERDHPWP